MLEVTLKSTNQHIMLKLCISLNMVTKQTEKILTVSGQLEIGQAGNLLKHHVFRVYGPFRLTPIDGCLSSKSV